MSARHQFDLPPAPSALSLAMWSSVLQRLGDNKLKLPSLQIEISHQHAAAPTQRRWPLPVRFIWSSVAVLAGSMLCGAMIAATSIVFNITGNDHPELFRAVRVVISDRIDRWETSHGIGCLSWVVTISEEGKPDRLEPRHGGPACAAEKPAELEGDAP